MKIIVDIENKTLKMLENERSIFKGEYGADKLTLLINKTLENEYPVITGLLSNGRKIGGYTTDDSYGTERIDGVTYTTANFTLSKENGFTLSEGLMQVTIWIYKTEGSVVVSKTAIGNITFNVVNTTAYNEGDIIVSGNVEGTVVNLKVELENLQAVAQNVNAKVKVLERASVLDTTTTNIALTLENNVDFAFSNEAIESIRVIIPNSVKHGFLGTFTIKIGESIPITFVNNSSYRVYYFQNGKITTSSSIELIANQSLLGSVICDGINVYVNLKELPDGDGE